MRGKALIVRERGDIREKLIARAVASDSDGSPEGGDGEAGSVRSTTARAEGIAKTQARDG